MSSSIKTAISIQQPLFEAVKSISAEMNISRSRLFSIAVEEFIKKSQQKKMLSEINEAFSDPPDQEEGQLQKKMKKRQQEIVGHDPW